MEGSVWESPEELHKCFLYWQNRALAAEREVEENWEFITEVLAAHDKLYHEYHRLEQIVEDSFSDYTKKIMEEEKRKGWIEVNGNR
jgi:hypothetical protein